MSHAENETLVENHDGLRCNNTRQKTLLNLFSGMRIPGWRAEMHIHVSTVPGMSPRQV